MTTAPTRVVLCLVPGFSIMGVASALEPLRIANRVSGREAFTWRVVSLDGASIAASNGITLGVNGGLLPELQALSRGELPDLAFVVAGLDVEKRRHGLLMRWVRALAKRDVVVGGISTGAWVLAAAGILDGKTCTLHWENIPAFAEHFPGVEVRQELCVMDGNVFTCAGGTSAIDMMLHVVASKLGAETAAQVAAQLILPAVRPLDQRQRGPIGRRLERADTRLGEAMRLMEESIGSPIALDELAGRLGLSRRQLERLFERDLGKSPAQYFLDLRLQRARHLLQQTELRVIEVAMACGFASAAHFSKCFRRAFGAPPHAVR